MVTALEWSVNYNLAFFCCSSDHSPLALAAAACARLLCPCTGPSVTYAISIAAEAAQVPHEGLPT